MRIASIGLIAFALLATAFLCGCIADTAEDTKLPWATNKSWEGMAPVAPSVIDRCEEVNG